jgi:membrane protein involved in colicin uptake
MPKQPAKKATKKTVKKAATKEVAAKKTVVKKVAAKKTVKKVAAKKVAAKKVVAKKAPAKKAAKKAVVTTVIAKIDAGFGNELVLRGSGAGLSWDSGAPMENSGADEWVWTSKAVTSELEFKVLLNDEVWSTGPNGIVFPGATVVFEPAF